MAVTTEGISEGATVVTDVTVATTADTTVDLAEDVPIPTPRPATFADGAEHIANTFVLRAFRMAEPKLK